MEKIHAWDRNEKLFAIRGLQLVPPEKAEEYLLQLVVDDDPVVRGKAAIALKNCSDEILVKAADTLLSNNEAETSILAMELLNSTEEINFAEQIENALNFDDERVVKSAIETIDRIPIDQAKKLLDRVLQDYDDSFDRALMRLLSKFHPDPFFPILTKWYTLADDNTRPKILQITADMSSSEAEQWTRKQIESLDISSRFREMILWILESG